MAQAKGFDFQQAEKVGAPPRDLSPIPPSSPPAPVPRPSCISRTSPNLLGAPPDIPWTPPSGIIIKASNCSSYGIEHAQSGKKYIFCAIEGGVPDACLHMRNLNEYLGLDPLAGRGLGGAETCKSYNLEP